MSTKLPLSGVASHEYRVPAWSGTVEDLEKLCNQLTPIVEKAKEAEITQANSTRSQLITRDVLEKYRETDEIIGDWEDKYEIKSLARKLGNYDLRIRATTKDGRSYEGPLSYILEYAEIPKIRELHIDTGASYGDTGGSLTIRLSRSYSGTVSVRSAHRDWLLYATNESMRIIQQNRPWYAWFKAHPVMAYMTVVLPSLIISSLAVRVSMDTESPAGIYASVTLYALVVCLGSFFVNFAVPHFELSVSAEKLYSKKIKKVGGATLALIVSAIALPIILSQMGVA
ncbi:hypothetical protein [Kocuria rosea]|uniref:hypothetical protein n=1 Tax=Kocuria rosea TaxID=1275 RepID=UPI002B24136D|nr:hypothetical protein [Kocuria rosea]MEB2619990.1 hypothetical protein [Kocuria rosea]